MQIKKEKGLNDKRNIFYRLFGTKSARTTPAQFFKSVAVAMFLFVAVGFASGAFTVHLSDANGIEVGGEKVWKEFDCVAAPTGGNGDYVGDGAIKACVDNASQGDVIYVKSGNYNIYETIVLPSYITLIVDGNLTLNNSVLHMFNDSSVQDYDIKIFGGRYDGNSAGQASGTDIFHFENISNLNIQDAYFVDPKHVAIEVNTIASGDWKLVQPYNDNIKLIDNKCERCGGGMAIVRHAQDVSMVGNKVSNSNSGGLGVTACHDVYFADNKIYTANMSGITLIAIRGTATNNYIYDTPHDPSRTYEGGLFSGEGGYSQDIIMTGNHIYDSATKGIQAGNGTGITIANNIINNSGTIGIYVAFDNPIITGNIVNRIYLDGVSDVDRIENPIISDNILTNVSGSCIYMEWTNNSYLSDNNVMACETGLTESNTRNTVIKSRTEITQNGTLTMDDILARDDLTVNDDIYLEDKIYHSGDTNTYWDFNDDDIYIYAGGSSIFRIFVDYLVFNEGGADKDFRAESDSYTHMFFLDGGNNRIGINNSSPLEEFDISGDLLVSGYANITTITGNSTWTHQSYPAACPGSSAVTTIGDSNTCQDLWVDEAGDKMTGTLDMGSNPIANVTALLSTLVNSTDLEATDDLTVGDDIYLEDKVYHRGDVDTYWDFSDDDIYIYAGAVSLFRIVEAAQDAVIVNEGGVDVDFRVESNDNIHMLFCEGSTNRCGINNSAPKADFDIIGDLLVSKTVNATTFIGNHSSSGGVPGFTGTCASETTLTVKDGLITGCS